ADRAHRRRRSQEHRWFVGRRRRAGALQIRDVAGRRRDRAGRAGRLMTVQRDDEELAALRYAVAHDLRAPLRAIEGFGEALAEEYGGRLGEEGTDYLRRIRGAAARMEQLIAALLELAQVSQGELQREPVDLSALAESIVAELRRPEPRRDVAVSIEPGLVVHGDRALLRIAFEHLLGNAWKFTGKHAKATIDVGSEGGVIFIR